MKLDIRDIDLFQILDFSKSNSSCLRLYLKSNYTYMYIRDDYTKLVFEGRFKEDDPRCKVSWRLAGIFIRIWRIENSFDLSLNIAPPSPSIFPLSPIADWQKSLFANYSCANTWYKPCFNTRQRGGRGIRGVKRP